MHSVDRADASFASMENGQASSTTEQVQLRGKNGDIDEQDSPAAHVAYYYGCGRCHPRWLQFLANAKFYTLILSLFIVVEGAIASGVMCVCINCFHSYLHDQYDVKVAWS